MHFDLAKVVLVQVPGHAEVLAFCPYVAKSSLHESHIACGAVRANVAN